MKHPTTARLLTLLVCALFLFSFSACATTATGGGVSVSVGEQPPMKGGPPPHAPAHGYRAKYTYNYYPDANVYFDFGRGLYFYLDEGEWRVSASLPAHIHVRLGEYVTIEMDTDRPYTKSKHHKKKYPPGQMKKKDKKGKKW